MGTIKKPTPVKFFIAVLFEEHSVLQPVLLILEEKFGIIEWRSEEIPFTYTDYYRKMGEHLLRLFLIFKPLMDPGELAERKIITNQMEKSTGEGARERKINLDPGYFDGGKIVLATTKNFSHRVYIGKGIYAEATIRWEKGDFRPFEYTYPDYRNPEYRPSLMKIRDLYRSSLSKAVNSEE
ncbi:MAG: DUF4416 family protein [Atribacterota bacterium]|nr:DUF4416 family protein [Candidatus Atribacteria bacterium]